MITLACEPLRERFLERERLEPWLKICIGNIFLWTLRMILGILGIISNFWNISNPIENAIFIMQALQQLENLQKFLDFFSFIKILFFH